MLKKLLVPFAVAAAMASCCNGGSCASGEAADSAKACADTVKKACGGCIKGDWNVVSANGVCATVDSVKPFISFQDSSKVNGHSGVNSFFGSFEKKGDTLAFVNIGQTKMMGPDTLMKVEDAITDAINKTASVKVCGDSAKIFNAEGNEIMVLVKKN